MKKLGVVLALFIVINVSAQEKPWGVGLRMGSLNGITVKKYNNNSDLEFSIGTSYYNIYNNFHNNLWSEWLFENSLVYTDIEFLDYRGSAPVGAQFRMLFHKNLEKIGDEKVSGLKWYYGIGGQFVKQTHQFSYRYKLTTKDWIYVVSDKSSEINFGIDGIIGLEYTFKEVPVSLFLDGNLFMEIFDDFQPWGQAGFGGRYRF
ncbi:MAG: hypothetical protein OEX02_02690 [Cyclobacteriaceae bacterium]|nr:hypothetical protein [Cyclobacteriaceae bacterium]